MDDNMRQEVKRALFELIDTMFLINSRLHNLEENNKENNELFVRAIDNLGSLRHQIGSYKVWND